MTTEIEAIAPGINRIPKPKDVRVALWTPESGDFCLVVQHKDGEVKALRISKAVAESLIAYGFSYEG